MKLILYVIISFIIGALAGYLFKKPEIKTEIKEVKVNQTAVTITKKTKKMPDGTETTDQVEQYLTNIYENKKALVQSNPVTVKRYSVSLLGLDSIHSLSIDARLGDLPLFVGGQLNIKEPKNSLLLLRFEF